MYNVPWMFLHFPAQGRVHPPMHWLRHTEDLAGPLSSCLSSEFCASPTPSAWPLDQDRAGFSSLASIPPLRSFFRLRKLQLRTCTDCNYCQYMRFACQHGAMSVHGIADTVQSTVAMLHQCQCRFAMEKLMLCFCDAADPREDVCNRLRSLMHHRNTT